MQVVVYILLDQETKHGDIPVENEQTRNFAQAQEADESLKTVRRRLRPKIIPRQNDLQGLPHLGRQIYNPSGS